LSTSAAKAIGKKTTQRTPGYKKTAIVKQSQAEQKVPVALCVVPVR